MAASGETVIYTSTEGGYQDHSHPHHTLSPYDRSTLVLCSVVLLTCALALLAQSCRISARIVQRAQKWTPAEYPDCPCAMANLEGGNGIITRYATRSGGIVEQVTEVNGIRKVVLVVNARLSTSDAQDAYADWFRAWCQRRDVGEGAADERMPLIGMEGAQTPRDCEEGGGNVPQRIRNSRDGSAGWAFGRELQTVKRLLTGCLRVPRFATGNQTLSSGSPKQSGDLREAAGPSLA